MSDEYTIFGLAKATGLTPRTIRSFVEKGLIPGPDSRGPNASYGREHLDRLRVISLLRDAKRDLTLAQIRALLRHLSADQIRDLAEGRLRIGGLIDTDEPAPSTALDYLRRVGRSGRGEEGGAESRHAELGRLLAALEAVAGRRPAGRGVRHEVWYRVRVTPDIELSVRGVLLPEEVATLNRIGDQMRHLLMRGG